VRKKLETSPIDLEGEDPLIVWYNLIIDSALQAGAILYDGRGLKKYFANNTMNSSLYNKTKDPTKYNLNPWWDKDCTVNKQKEIKFQKIY